MNQCNVHLLKMPNGDYTGQYLCMTCGATQDFPKNVEVTWNSPLDTCGYPEQIPEAEPGHMAEDKSWVESLVPGPTSRERQLSDMLEDYKTVTHAFASILHKMESEYDKDECCDYTIINGLIEEISAITAAFRLRNY